MNFAEILPHLLTGARARRALWEGNPSCGTWVQLVNLTTASGQDIRPQLMSWDEITRTFNLWGGINQDIQATDWELLP